jgi:hypothetical protein
MPALTLTYNGANGKPHDWRHVSVPLGQIVTLLNITKLDYYNVQNYGLRSINLRMHAGINGGHFRVHNNSGSTIAQDSLIYASDAYNNGVDVLPTCLKAVVTSTTGTSRYAIGILTETLDDGETGNASMFYEKTGIDTSGLTLLAPIYLHTTAGGYTTAMPAAPNRVQIIGYCAKVSTTAGRIQFVLPGHLIPYSVADQVV